MNWTDFGRGFCICKTAEQSYVKIQMEHKTVLLRLKVPFNYILINHTIVTNDLYFTLKQSQLAREKCNKRVHLSF
ncbi:hypothetical protein XELAEV_18002953mg [Xenopus laevis]|nr:hypothetical protein XELAEV_18002953mg [Xenopus laevis]